MRAWFYRHPNVGAVLAALWFLVLVAFASHNLDEGRWGLVALNLVSLFAPAWCFWFWWRRT